MKIKHGDILTVSEGIIIQQVNAQGVMGSGLAKQIKNKYPIVFDEYKNTVSSFSNKSSLMGHAIPVRVSSNLLILNIFAQFNFGRDPNVRYTSYDALDKAFKIFSEKAIIHNDEWPKGDIHIPEIGAGLGNGKWKVIEQIIAHHLTAEFSNKVKREVYFWKQ